MDAIHTFEKAGLGKAPFHLVGNYQHHEHSQGDTLGVTDYGTNCDYCGTYIRNVFMIKSADGKTFKVGSECVKKTGDSGLKYEINRIKNQQRKAREAARYEAALKVIPDLKDELNKLPHPYARTGATMYDYCIYITTSRWAYDSSKLKVTRAVESILKRMDIR